MEKPTRERILDAALVCFAENGYKGTNLRDLAAGLNLSKSALYKHYESKEAIWNALLDRMEQYYSERFGSPERPLKVPDSLEELAEMTMKLLDFTVHDERVILTRRVLLTEQFRDERAKRFAGLHFLYGTQEMFAAVFRAMMDKGLLQNDDPALLAFVYTAPITAMVHACDREPEKEAEFTNKIRGFIRHFLGQYGK